jgi:hypothetical protein
MELDHVGPFPKTKKGNTHVLSVIDHFTRKRWFIGVPSTNAEDTFEAFLNICAQFEFPSIILTDRGPAFTSKLAEEFTKLTNITPTFALTNQHNTVGSVERSNLIMEEIIKKFVDKVKQDDWDEYLSLAAYAINKSPSTTHGYEPDFLIFGELKNSNLISSERGETEPVLEYANEKTKKLKKAIENAKIILNDYREKMIEKSKEKLNSRKETEFKENDLVYLQKDESDTEKGLSHKLDDKSLGPFKVIEWDKDKGNVIIEVAPNYTLTVKMNQLRLAKDQGQHLDNNEVTILSQKPQTELIILSKLSEFPKKENKNCKGRKPNLMNFTVKSLVGRRINIEWTAGRLKGWHKATVIGYTQNLTNNLIYYDVRTEGVDKTVDYYSHNLFHPNNPWKIL